MELDSEQRPWGSWHVIDVNHGYKIKRIHVNPHSRLSYQTHRHRSEHWVVIAGTAVWAVALVVLLLLGDRVDRMWTWTCVAAIGLSALGLVVMRWQGQLGRKD